MRTAFSVERTEADYYEAIEGKTASLMSSSCRVGALTAGLGREETEALAEFGRCFGMVYQLRDDILDVIATDNQLGKPAGQDLAEGIYNLPTLLRAARLRRRRRAARRARARPRRRGPRARAQARGRDRRHRAHRRAPPSASSPRPTARSRSLPSAQLREGFAALISSLLEDLPEY